MTDILLARSNQWLPQEGCSRYPWVEDFVRDARPGQTALFTDPSGRYVLEDD